MPLHLRDESLIGAEQPFKALLERPGVVEILKLRSRFGFMAFHGGWLEEMTDDVAAGAAQASGASLYAVLQGPDDQWHLPSHLVLAQESEALTAFLEHTDVVISIHGFGRRDLLRSVLLGGSNRELAQHVADCLAERLDGYEVLYRPGEVPKRFAGQHPDNPVNRAKGGGVQVELPPRIRGKSPIWRGRAEPSRVPPHQSLIDALAAAARSWS